MRPLLTLLADGAPLVRGDESAFVNSVRASPIPKNAGLGQEAPFRDVGNPETQDRQGLRQSQDKLLNGRPTNRPVRERPSCGFDGTWSDVEYFTWRGERPAGAPWPCRPRTARRRDRPRAGRRSRRDRPGGQRPW